MPTLHPIPIPTKGEPFFTRTLNWIRGRRWTLADDWYYKLPNGTQVKIARGFEFDGASIPHVFRVIVSPTGVLFIPALIHDYAYRYHHLVAIGAGGEEQRYDPFPRRGRHYWDRLFRDVSNEVNGMPLINFVAWAGVWTKGLYKWTTEPLAVPPP